jgi:hypothetical protein
MILVIAISVGLVAFFTSNVNGQISYTVTVVVQGLPSNMSTNIYLDGAPNGTLSGGQSKSYDFSASPVSHTITVDFYVPNSVGASGTRYYNKEPSWSFNAGGTHAFNYTTQYFLTVVTPYSSAEGQGWYDSGTSVQPTLKEGEVKEGQWIRHVFTGWNRDASGTELRSDSLLMNAPKNATASWRTQYYLTVESDPPNVTSLSGAGWYDAGNGASFSAPAIVPATEDTRLRFEAWTGSYSGQSPSGNIVMNRPEVIKAHYLAQYQLAIVYSPASLPSSYNETHAGWYDAGTNVQLGPAPRKIPLSSVEQLYFLGWSEGATPFSDVSLTVAMDGPHRFLLSYKTQYYVEVRSSYGSVTGSGWYDKGSTAKIVASDTAGNWPVTYILTGWTVEPPNGKLTKTDDSWTLTVDRPYVVEAVWSTDYFPLITLFGGGAVAVAALAVGIVLAYRRGLLTRGGPALQPPPKGRTRVCTNCGNRMPEAAVFCQKCGASVSGAAVSTRTPLENKVYDYIVKHEGVISLSRASKDLGITLEELKETTEKLKKEGRLA